MRSGSTATPRRRSVQINYQAIGSGGGIKQLLEGTVDFGASDAPMSDEEISKAKSPILHIPTVLGAVVITYNLPEVAKPLNLTGPVIADIFLGKVTKWNAPEIAALNKGVTLPEQGHPRRAPHARAAVRRTSSPSISPSVSPAWASGPGKGKELQWPVGLGGEGTMASPGQVRQTAGLDRLRRARTTRARTSFRTR